MYFEKIEKDIEEKVNIIVEKVLDYLNKLLIYIRKKNNGKISVVYDIEIYIELDKLENMKKIDFESDVDELSYEQDLIYNFLEDNKMERI